jgi:hypothetical protein
VPGEVAHHLAAAHREPTSVGLPEVAVGHQQVKVVGEGVVVVPVPGQGRRAKDSAVVGHHAAAR